MSLTSPIKPRVDSFLVDPPGSTYTIVNPVDEYIYVTNRGGTVFLVLPVAATLYAGFRIRLSNLQTGLINIVSTAIKAPDTFYGDGNYGPGIQTSFITDGVDKWYQA